MIECKAKECEKQKHQFGFCEEHFKQFKFGVINKKGENVPDYEHKMKHYRAFCKKQKLRDQI